MSDQVNNPPVIDVNEDLHLLLTIDLCFIFTQALELVPAHD